MIQVVGWTNHSNIGDESYKLSFPILFPEQHFEFNDPDIISDDNCVVLGGGNILSNHYLEKMASSKANRKIAFSVSATSHTPCKLLENFDQVFVRDYWSLNYLKNNNIECQYCPDASTILTGNKEKGLNYIENQFKKKGHHLYENKVGIVLNSYTLGGSQDQLSRNFLNFQKIVYDLAKIIDHTNASFIFFSMSTGMPQDDRNTNGYLANFCKFWKKNIVIYDELSVQETLDLIASCNVIISSRLHSSIFAVNNHTPFLDITHHDKNKFFLKSNNIEDCGYSYWNFDSFRFAEHLKVLIDDNYLYKEKMAQLHLKQIKLLEEGTKHVCFGK